MKLTFKITTETETEELELRCKAPREVLKPTSDPAIISKELYFHGITKGEEKEFYAYVSKNIKVIEITELELVINSPQLILTKEWTETGETDITLQLNTIFNIYREGDN